MPEPSGRSIFQRAWYRLVQFSLRVGALCLFRLRLVNVAAMPATGPVVVLANHGSHLDPPLVGVAIGRRLNFLARQSLFDNWLFGGLIRSLDAIPINRDGPGLAGLRETLRRLKRGEPVVVFPEGARSRDGRMQPLMPGFVVLLRRGGAAALPLGIAGAHEAMPPGKSAPRLRQIVVAAEAPLSAEEIAGLSDEALLAEIETRIRRAIAKAESIRRQRKGRTGSA